MKKSLLLIAICFASFLSGCGGGTIQVLDVATHFSVTSANAAPTAGISFNITVTALDAAGQMVATYSGTVHFTSSNGQPVLPASAMLTNGTGTFSVTVSTVGSQTISVTDGASLTGSSSPLTVSPDVATQFSVTPSTPTPTAGTAFNFTVTALDAANKPFPAYSGTAQFTSSDPQASFAPASAPLMNGTGTFSVTLKTAGAQTITATDTVKASITGISAAAKVSPGPATQLSFGSLGNAFITRHPIAVTLYALDAFNNTATSYSGTVSFKSTDLNAILPKPLLFTNGVQSTTLTLETTGTQTFTVTDTVTASLTKTSGPITVTAAPMLAITSAAPPKGTVNVDYGPTKTVEELCQRSGYHGVSCSPCQPSNPCDMYPQCGGSGNVYPCHELVQVFAGFTFKAIGGVPPYQWSASALPPGLTVNATNGEILGTPTKFGIYSNIGAMVTDSGNPAAQTAANVSITIFAPPLISTSIIPTDATVGTAYSATLTTSGGTSPVTWSVSAGTLPPGLTLSATTGTITGTPTTEGFFSFSVQAADSSTPQLTATLSFSVAVNPQPVNNAALNGQYAFAFRGFNAYGPDGIVGSLTADGKGNLTSGLLDLNQVQGGVISQAFTGTYEIFADNRGIMKLMTSPGGADLGTFRFAVGSITAGVASKGRFVNFDPPVNNSPMEGEGIFEKQDPTAFSTAKITGDYAFGVSAASADSSNTKFGAAGRFTASAGTISSGTIDEDNRGTVTSNVAFTGTYSVAATGRGTMTLTIAGAANPVNLVFYVVSAGELLVQNSEVENVISLFAGTILQQSGAGTFSNSSLNTATVIALNGLTANGPSDVVLGLLDFPSAGNFKFLGDENNGGTLQALNQSGTYSVASNGRVTVRGTPQPLVFYLVAANQGFVVGTDSISTTGFLEPQSGAPFSNASANGAFFFGVSTPGVPVPANFLVTYESGVASFNGAGSVTGTTDYNNSSLFPNQAFTDTYTISATGRGTMTTSGIIFYVISPSKYVLMSGTAGAAYSSITEGEK